MFLPSSKFSFAFSAGVFPLRKVFIEHGTALYRGEREHAKPKTLRLRVKALAQVVVFSCMSCGHREKVAREEYEKTERAPGFEPMCGDAT